MKNIRLPHRFFIVWRGHE